MLPICFSIISGIDGVLVGLSLTYMLNISYLLQYLLNVSVETETCVSYSNLYCFIYRYTDINFEFQFNVIKSV